MGVCQNNGVDYQDYYGSLLVVSTMVWIIRIIMGVCWWLEQQCRLLWEFVGSQDKGVQYWDYREMDRSMIIGVDYQEYIESVQATKFKSAI